MAKEKAKPWFSIKKEHLFLFVIIAAALAAFNYSPDQLPVVGDDYTIIDQAVASHDLSLCDKIEAEHARLNCKERVIIAMQAPEKCVELPDDKADTCFYHIALDTKSHVVCSVIKNTEKHDRCYRDIVLSTNDMWPCLNITDPDQRDYCFYEVARFVGELSGCEEIQSTYLADLCFWDYAGFNKDLTVCEKILMPDTKEKCIVEASGTEMCSPSNCEACSKEECTRVVGCDPITIYPQGSEAEYGGCGSMEL